MPETRALALKHKHGRKGKFDARLHNIENAQIANNSALIKKGVKNGKNNRLRRKLNFQL